MNADRRDLGAGAVFIAVALLYGGIAYGSLPIGRALAMGPGYFPLVLSILLAAVGAILVVQGLVAAAPAPFFDRIAWRPIVAISAAVLFFGTFLRQAGLFPAVFVAALVCSFAGEGAEPRRAALVGLCLAALCTLIFGYAVRLPLPVFGTWFPGGG